MTYIIEADGIIANIIIADEEFATRIGAKDYYDGARIGDAYAPPEPAAPEPTEQEDTDAMLVDQEYRLTLLWLGVTEEV